MDSKSQNILSTLNNSHVTNIINKYIEICKPDKVSVLNGTPASIEYIKKLALKSGEEQKLATKGHSVHFDGYEDQARDLLNTKVMISGKKKLYRAIKTIDREDGLKEVFRLLDGLMKGKEMFVKFYCLGPVNSAFSIPALQITDSAYVLHSEDILYRQGYDEFMRLRGENNFFHFVHSSGALEGHVSKNVDKRRVYVDLEDNRVFTLNTQYAGNSVGLKKLALRLAIQKACNEGWLCEHMFVMGVSPDNSERTTYFAGAFPSGCGKTSTAMVPGQKILGDDIAYIRPSSDGSTAKAVNVEQGIFGIIRDINPEDDPVIYRAMNTPRELIFSNVLINQGNPYWLNMGKELPKTGVNYSGNWSEKNLDRDGNEILPAHKNARYTIRIDELENADRNMDNQNGVTLQAMVFGGRDPDTTVPVYKSLSWRHGVLIGLMIESETTAAALGTEGVKKHNPMSIVEFLTVSLGAYADNYLKFGERLSSPPDIFSTNYFLKKNGEFLNSKLDKKVWLLWMEAMVNNELEGLDTPIGIIPKYDDLKKLFNKALSKKYTEDNYVLQFSIRARKSIDKLNRIELILKGEDDMPRSILTELQFQKERLEAAEKDCNTGLISPFTFARAL